MTLSGALAVVTGGNRGIGFEVCRQLAAAGAQVLLTSRDEKSGIQAVAVLRKTGHSAIPATLDVTHALAPRMAANGHIVMVSSAMGQLSAFSKPMRRRLLDPALTRESLIALMESFIAGVRTGTHEKDGWPHSAYRVSKAGLNALTKILAGEPTFARMRINAVSPGWVRTDMGGRSAPRSVEVGAASVVWGATLPPTGPTGGFFQDGEALEW